MNWQTRLISCSVKIQIGGLESPIGHSLILPQFLQSIKEKFRKQGFKSAEDLFNKIEQYFKAVMDAVTKYTGGYPYKEGSVPPEGEKAA